MNLIEPQQIILIKTYLHESGLFYLAKTLGNLLKAEGHTVIYVPKSKYLLDGSIFYRDYLEPSDPDILKGEAVHWFDKRHPIENQVSNAITKYNASVMISFETLMEKSQWLSRVKQRNGIRIIDVPMVEWVNERFLAGRSYSVFDEIWCLTNQCQEYFKNYSSAKKVKWDWIDHNLFFPVEREEGSIRFYHAGSLNSEYSSKNTELVLEAFEIFLKGNPEANLVVSGKITDRKSLRIIEKHNNISVIDGVLERKDVAKLYQQSHCILAPSSREGLGLSLYEAQACNSLVVTTDLPPMNEFNTKYLCKTSLIKQDQKLTPMGILTAKEIAKQIQCVYGDLICQKSK